MTHSDHEGEIKREIEQKFAFRNAEAAVLLQCLRGLLPEDSKYPVGTISSLYFDSPNLDLYDEKVNSDYIKTKVRLRWYDDCAQNDPEYPIPCFLEVKRKIGSLRQKARQKIDVVARDLCNPFENQESLELGDMVLGMGFLPSFLLRPMVIIAYRRHRFVDYQSSSRISLDTEIRCPMVNPHTIPCPGSFKLAEAVLEVKGEIEHLPRSLYPLSSFLFKNAFSKYARCVERALHPSAFNIG